jgi:hypothetical protein
LGYVIRRKEKEGKIRKEIQTKEIDKRSKKEKKISKQKNEERNKLMS